MADVVELIAVDYNVNPAIRALNKLDSKAKTTARTLSRAGKAANDNFRKATKSADKFGGSLSRLKSLAAPLIGIFAFGAIARQFVNVTKRAEDFRSSLVSVTGSAKDYQRNMDILNEVTSRFPVSLAVVEKGLINLNANGVKPTVSLLEGFANAASITTDKVGAFTAAIRLFARATAKGKIDLEDLNSLADRGVPVFSLLKKELAKTGDTLDEVKKSTEGVNRILGILEKAFQSGIFAGAAERDLDTVNGQIIALSTNFDKLLIAIGAASDSSSIFVGVLKGLNASFVFLAENAETIVNILAGITAGIVAAGFFLIAKNIFVVVRAVKALTLAFLANPLLAIPVIIAAAVIAFLEFKNELITIKGVTASVTDFFQASWEVVLERTIKGFRIFQLKAIREILRINDAMASILPDIIAPKTLSDEQKAFADALTISGAFKGAGDEILRRADLLANLRKETEFLTDATNDLNESNKKSGLIIDIKANELSILRGQIDQLKLLADASGRSKEAYDKLTRSIEINKRVLEIRNKLVKEGVTVTNAMTTEIRSLVNAEFDLNDIIDKNIDLFDNQISIIKDYAKEVRDIQTQLETTVVGTFQKIEDALVDFVKTGKLSIKDLVNTILSEFARIFIRQQIIGPLLGLIGFSDGGTFEKQTSFLGFAKGGAFDKKVNNYGSGTVINQPTAFSFNGGRNLGILGEAGPEAILPLKRTNSGKLGVELAGNGSNRPVVIMPSINITFDNVNVDSGIDIDEMARDISIATAKYVKEELQKVRV